MGLNAYNKNSDYGSGGSSVNSSTSWGSEELDWKTFQSHLLNPRPRTKAASYSDLVNGRCTIEDVMQEFRMNGSDSPYNPGEDRTWSPPAGMPTISPAYMRQTSWPAPDRTPSQRLARPLSASYAVTTQPTLPKKEVPPYLESLTEEQRRVLSSLPDACVLTLLREMQRLYKRLPTECRFCKNNGERESYYRAHALKDAEGKVSCPVLRAFVCKRCGARGDDAHTIKYCPLSTSEERLASAAMLRSVRLASGRRRAPPPPPAPHHVQTHTLLQDGVSGLRRPPAPLGPLWAALEQKLML